MSIRTINLCLVARDDCDATVMLPMWQDANKLGWSVPIDGGGGQRCPVCIKKYTDKLFEQANLSKIAKKCPLSAEAAQEAKTCP